MNITIEELEEDLKRMKHNQEILSSLNKRKVITDEDVIKYLDEIKGENNDKR